MWREVRSTCGTESKVDFITGTVSVDVRLRIMIQNRILLYIYILSKASFLLICFSFFCRFVLQFFLTLILQIVPVLFLAGDEH